MEKDLIADVVCQVLWVALATRCVLAQQFLGVYACDVLACCRGPHLPLRSVNERRRSAAGPHGIWHKSPQLFVIAGENFLVDGLDWRGDASEPAQIVSCHEPKSAEAYGLNLNESGGGCVTIHVDYTRRLFQCD